MRVEITKTIGVEITKTAFERYEEVRKDATVNMMDKALVETEACLSQDQITAIQKNYDVLAKEYRR